MIGICYQHYRLVAACLLACILVILPLQQPLAQVLPNIKGEVLLRAFDRNADNDVVCPANFTYVAAKGCVSDRGRVDQFTMTGFSPVIGTSQCIPEMSESANPTLELVDDDVLNNAQMLTLESGDVIAVSASSNGVFFNRYNNDMTLISSEVAIVDMSGDIGFSEHNEERDDNLVTLPYFKAVALNDARWAIAFLARSKSANQIYVMGAVVNSDALEFPSETVLEGSNIFPISYEGTLFDDEIEIVAPIPSNTAFDIVGLKDTDGTLNGRFAVAWVRNDYYKPSQGFSIFGKIFDESVQEVSPLSDERFGFEQGEIRLENTSSNLSSSAVKLAAIQATEGFALAYNDPAFIGSGDEGVIRAFESGGALYKDGDDEFVGSIGNIRKIVDIKELTSGTLMALHTRNNILSASLIDTTTSGPGSPVLLDANGDDVGDEVTLTILKASVDLISTEILSSDRSKILLTWLEDRSSVSGLGVDSVRSMLVNYDAVSPTLSNVSRWYRIDSATDFVTLTPRLISNSSNYVMSKHLKSINTSIGTEHHVIVKYDAVSSRAVYRKYIISQCW